MQTERLAVPKILSATGILEPSSALSVTDFGLFEQFHSGHDKWPKTYSSLGENDMINANKNSLHIMVPWNLFVYTTWPRK